MCYYKCSPKHSKIQYIKLQRTNKPINKTNSKLKGENKMSNKTKKVKGLQLFFLNLTKGNKDKSIKNKTKINYPPDTEEIINIKEIIVPSIIQNSCPNANKVINYTKRFEQNGMVDEAITVKKTNLFGTDCYILTNGYIRYLILKQNGISEIPVKFQK